MLDSEIALDIYDTRVSTQA